MKKKKTSGKFRVIPPSYFKKVNVPEKLTEITPGAVLPEAEPVVNAPVKRPSEAINATIGGVALDEKATSVMEESPVVAAPKEKVIERPQILAERNARKVSALSLKSIQKQQQLKKELVASQPDAENLPTEEFSEAQMQKAWSDYTKMIEKNGKFNLHSQLTMGIPKLEGTLIHLVFPNATIKVEVERAKFDLLSFLRSTLNNHAIDLSIEVNEAEQKRYAYTSREKFEKLREKNPLIDTLRQEFDLDV